MSIAADSQLGPYKIIALIGEGGMGAVYRAKDTRLGRDVAVKILPTTDDRERLQRFEQEARTTGMLNHPNLLTVFDVGVSDGTPYLVSELLEGETLHARLQRGAVSPRIAVEIALQLAQGLAAAHEKGVVHRDLKPDNVFLTRDRRVKILDFGIAKLNPGSDGPTFQVAATEPGMVLGTVGYMSPEQVRGEPVDGRSDIFSLGTILYEMISGSRAFKHDSAIETLTAILKEEPPDLADRLPNIPPAVDRLVRRCLEKERERRFQSARDLAFNLETLSTLSSHGTLSSSVPTPDVTQPPTMRMPTPPAASKTQSSMPRTQTTSAPTMNRPRPTLSQPRPRRGVSPILLTLLFIVAVAGALFGGWTLANRMRPAPPEPRYKRMTFRRGDVRGARFTPDGDSIVYSAAWDGRPAELFIGNRNTPEARPLGVSDAEVAAVSKSTELALILRRDRVSGFGTLARVPLAGGTPREIAENVVSADWSPDGNNLALIRFDSGRFRLEYPAGTVRYETPHAIRDVRVAPDERIAFIETEGGKYDVAVLEKNSRKPVSVARGWDHGAAGLAWSPDAKEVWLTGSDSGAPPSLYAVDVTTGDVHLVSHLTGAMKLFDVSPAGRALITNSVWRAALEYSGPGDTAERDLSWFDWSILADLSRDGRTILFNETREGGGTKNAIYLRRVTDPTPVRIGDGFGDALSPDGKWVLAHNGSKLQVLPTGSGEVRDLPVNAAFDLGAAWFNDSHRVVLGGALPGKGYQLHVIDTLDNSVRAITPENIWGDAFRPFAVSPDGRSVAGMTTDQKIALYSADGSAQPQPLATEAGEIPIAFSADGAALYVYRANALPAQVFRVTLATGAREAWKQFMLADPAGVYKIPTISITPDGNAYAYAALRTLSDLYVAEGLR